MFLKPLRTLFAPFVLLCIRRRRFFWRGIPLEGFYHRYNVTWAGERLVEIPIARIFLANADPSRTLEVGNVLSHYGDISHRVLDKFEVGAGVINSDILDYCTNDRFSLILSISTFEHIGFDDDAASTSGEKISAAVMHCRNLLTPDGVLVLTVPLGYNPDLDRLIASGELRPTQQSFLVRTGFSKWESCDLETARAHPYRYRYPYANSLGILEFKNVSSGT